PPRAADGRSPKNPGAAVRDMAQRAKAAVMSVAAAGKPSIVEKLWGKPQSPTSLLADASADASATGSIGPSQNPALGGTQPLYDRSTAGHQNPAAQGIPPGGSKLEAASGLGSQLDHPRNVHVKMQGA